MLDHRLKLKIFTCSQSLIYRQKTQNLLKTTSQDILVKTILNEEKKGVNLATKRKDLFPSITKMSRITIPRMKEFK